MRRLSSLTLVVGFVASMLGSMPATAQAASLSAPTLVGPGNGSSINGSNPVLSWNAVGGAVKYRVQMSSTSAFSSTSYSVDTVALTATPQTQLAFQTWYWRVAAIDTGGTVGAYAQAYFNKTTSSAPVPVSPINNQTLVFPTNPVLFTWQPVPGAVSYSVQVANSSAMTLAHVYSTRNTSYAMTDTQAFTLNDGTTAQSWYWQVQAVFPNAQVTDWSTARKYQVSWPATPNLVSPANGATGVTEVVFSWDPIPGAASYQIQVSPNGDWQNNITFDRVVDGTRYAPYPTLLNTSYFWRVRARAAGSANNLGPWSPDGRFFTRSWPARPVIYSPHWAGGAASPPATPSLELSWTPASAGGAGWVDHASHYELNISADLNFTTYTTCYTNHTTFTPYLAIIGGGEPGACNTPLSLTAGITYYWRVRGIDATKGVLGLWDNTSSADTQRFIYWPAMPDPSSPPNNASVEVPTLTWSAVSGATQYLVSIVNKSGGSPVLTGTTYATSYTPTSTLTAADGPFSWYVQAKDGAGNWGAKPDQADWRKFSIVTPTTDVSLALQTPSSGAAAIRMPSMSWTPYTGATYYQVEYGNNLAYISLSGSVHLPYAAFTYADVPLPAGTYSWRVKAFDASSSTPLATSSWRPFSVGIEASYGDWIVPWSDYRTPECTAQTDPATARCTPTLGDTQEMSWNPDPQAGLYIVTVALDANFTNVYHTYKTAQTTLTPRESWKDSQAGESYYWFVRPCVDSGQLRCGPGPDTNAGLNNASAYKKSSPAVSGLATTTAANPPVPAPSTIANQVTFNWSDYITTSKSTTYPKVGANSTRVTQEAMEYNLTVATAADFNSSSIVEGNVRVDQTQYTPWSKTYPEGSLYWRVQAVDGSGNLLTMSANGVVTKASPKINLLSPAGGATVTGVPYLQWEPQNWAARYTVEVYRNGDTNFSPGNLTQSATTPIAAWVPLANLPAGTYAWRVRRLDVGSLPGPWSNGRTFTLRSAAPSLSVPVDLAKLNGSNLLFQWTGVANATNYRFQSSTTADFSSITDDKTTAMTSWSPVSAYTTGTHYWRVSVLDGSGNSLGTSSVRSFTVGVMPGAPTGAHAVAGNTIARVTWVAPTSSGSAPIASYIATRSPGGKTCTATAPALSCTVGGLTNAASYTFVVQARTSFGTGPASGASNAVVPKSVSTLVVSAATAQSGTVAFPLTVRAIDGVGTTQSGYRGTVHFTSSDPLAVLPANYAFTVADKGSRTFNVTLKTYGTASVTATDTVTGTIAGAQSGIAVIYAASHYYPIAPRRVLDSRPTASTGIPTNMGLKGVFTAGTVRTFAVAGAHYVGGGSAAAIPATAVAVTGNLTIVGETAAGVVALGPTMTATGAVTTINVVKGDIRANNVTVGLSPTGTLSAVYRASAGARTDVVFDVTGYFLPGTGGATYHTLTPGRILDTRPTGGIVTHIGPLTKLPTKTVRTFPIAGVKALGWSSALVPFGAVAVTGNVTVTNATSAGYVSLGPTMVSVPSTSTANVAASSNVANGVTVALAAGKLSIVWVGTTGSKADVIFDVTGFFTADTSGLSYHAVSPARMLDSSKNQGLSGKFATSSTRLMVIGGVGAIPADAKGISGNLTITSPTTAGWALVSPEVVTKPTTSTVNANPGQAVANGFDVSLGASHHVALEWVGKAGSSANLSLDVTGYWK